MDDDGYVVYVAQANSKLLDLLLALCREKLSQYNNTRVID
jgi:hypothetical protein